MSIWFRLGEFFSRASPSGFGALDVIESVRTFFEGDPQLRRKVSFSIAMIALSAKMAKADGVVTQDEIRAFQQIFAVPADETRNVARLYDLAKQDIAGYEAYAERMARLCGSGRENCAMLGDILDGLFHIAKADGTLHEREGDFLRRIAGIFRIDDARYESMLARHVDLGAADPYVVLGIERGTAVRRGAAALPQAGCRKPSRPDDRARRAGGVHLHRHHAPRGDQCRLRIDRTGIAGRMSGFLPDHTRADVRVSPNFGPRRDGLRPDMIILHYTGMESAASAEAWLCDPVSEVSSHYLVNEDGSVVQMVRESDRAWHAGRGSWRGRSDINSCSVGIEIVNPGHAYGYPDFLDAQIVAVTELCRDIAERHLIRPERVLAHSDTAPGRKIDPGEKFPWARLNAAGVGHYVDPSPIRGGRFLTAGERGEPVEALQSMLALYGYGVEITGIFDPVTTAAVAGFQRHFRPARVDGIADQSTIETLHRLLAALPPDVA